MEKEFVKRNKSRGYSGWVFINGEKFYCRSSIEFIYLHHFINKYNKIDGYEIKMEKIIFESKGEKYKPDFLIYFNNVLIKIIEIKSDKNQIDRENKGEKYEIFKDYFNKIKIDFEILYKDSKILTNNIREKLEIWKDETRFASIDGENNPMFGMKHSDESKKKIGLKTIERCKDPEFLDFLKSRMKKTDEQKDHCRVMAIKRQAREKINRDLIKLEKYGLIITKKCVVCYSEFKDYEKKTRITCKNSCTFKLRYSRGEIKLKNTGLKSFRTRIINYLFPFRKEINKTNINEFESMITLLKIKDELPSTFGISHNTIIKYFGSFEALKKELNNENNKD